MIVQETIELNGRQYVRTYSNENREVISVIPPQGSYAEALDPVGANRAYVECEPMTDNISNDAALDIILGGEGE